MASQCFGFTHTSEGVSDAPGVSMTRGQKTLIGVTLAFAGMASCMAHFAPTAEENAKVAAALARTDYLLAKQHAGTMTTAEHCELSWRDDGYMDKETCNRLADKPMKVGPSDREYHLGLGRDPDDFETWKGVKP